MKKDKRKVLVIGLLAGMLVIGVVVGILVVSANPSKKLEREAWSVEISKADREGNEKGDGQPSKERDLKEKRWDPEEEITAQKIESKEGKESQSLVQSGAVEQENTEQSEQGEERTGQGAKKPKGKEMNLKQEEQKQEEKPGSIEAEKTDPHSKYSEEAPSEDVFVKQPDSSVPSETSQPEKPREESASTGHVHFFEKVYWYGEPSCSIPTNYYNLICRDCGAFGGDGEDYIEHTPIRKEEVSYEGCMAYRIVDVTCEKCGASLSHETECIGEQHQWVSGEGTPVWNEELQDFVTPVIEYCEKCFIHR